MIFFFSGTGNSEYVMKQIAQKIKDEHQIRMTVQEMNQEKVYDLTEEEYLGFVLPIYWWGIPKLVEQFIEKIHFTGYQNQYVYLFVTYGGSAGSALALPEKILSEKGIRVNGQFGLKLVDNYIPVYDLPSKEKQMEIIESAKPKLHKIIDTIHEKREDEIIEKGIMKYISKPVHFIYQKSNFAKGFWVDDRCIHCQKCSKQCPCDVIHMVDGKPVWGKDCSFCLACIHQCPVQAIQYKKGTVKRGRYYNPMLKS